MVLEKKRRTDIGIAQPSLEQRTSLVRDVLTMIPLTKKGGDRVLVEGERRSSFNRVELGHRKTELISALKKALDS